MGKYTKADIKRIANAMRRQKDDKPDRPYSLLTGAGCSKTAGIPLAGELVTEIKDKYKLDIEHRLGKDCDDDYGACMSVLSSNEVKSIIQPHLDKAGVNWGHLAIASLMKAEYVGRVLTFNFDSVLARACGLLGEYPATYDFVSSASSRTDHIAQQAILHLHGQGHSLAILNSEEETREHAKNLRPLLIEIFSKTPVIVAGYSGKSDAVFDVIKDIYNGAERLHWTDFPEDCGPHIMELLETRPNVCEFLGGADSDIFFMDLAKELKCWPPKLFDNPFAHLLDELQPIVDYPGSDTDILAAIKEKLTEKSRESDLAEDDASNLIIKGDWDAAEAILGARPMDENERKLLAIALKSKADKLTNYGKCECTLEELEESCDLYARAYAINKKIGQTALHNWANSLSELAKIKADEEMFQNSFEKYELGFARNPNDDRLLYDWGLSLSDLARIKKSPNIYKQSFEKYEASIDINPNKHESLINLGASLINCYTLDKDEKHLGNAERILAKAQVIDPAEVYNLACLYSIQGKEKKAKNSLLKCEAMNTLPNKNVLTSDADLDILREKEWFKELLERVDNPKPK